MEWNNISFTDLCLRCKDNWNIQYKLPNVDIWLDYDIHKVSFVSFIVFCQMGVKWRYRRNVLH